VRLLAGLVAVLLLAGCGAVAGRSGAPAAPAAGPLADAPPLQALDEAPPEQVQRLLDDEFRPLPADFGESSGTGSSTTVFAYSWGIDTFGSGGAASTAAKPTAAQMAQIRADFDARRTAISPAPGSAPRVVARLPLAAGGDALFVAWRNHDGLLCTETQVVADYGGGGGGPGGPCALSGPYASTSHCAEICLASDGSGGDLASTTWVLSGTVDAGADVIDVTTADGTTAEYPLTGPVLDGGDRRVFMLELGKADWRKLTLLRGGDIVDQTAMPALSAASEDCSAKLGPMPTPEPTTPPVSGPIAPTPEMEAWDASFQSCMTASGALPAFPAPTP